MKKDTNNKGFTLVELIVVLVILAILAAILVPALLGYIDRAREKQYVLNAKSYLTAAQAELSSLYGEGKEPGSITARSTQIQNTADVSSKNTITCEVGNAAKYDSSKTDKSEIHKMYTIAYVKYTEGSVTLYFDGSTWVSEGTVTAPGDTWKVK